MHMLSACMSVSVCVFGHDIMYNYVTSTDVVLVHVHVRLCVYLPVPT